MLVGSEGLTVLSGRRRPPTSGLTFAFQVTHGLSSEDQVTSEGDAAYGRDVPMSFWVIRVRICM